MKNVYLKKHIPLTRIDDYLYDNSTFFDADVVPINDKSKKHKEIQLLNYIEIPSLNITLYYCYNQTFNNKTNNYETDFNFPFIIVKNLFNDEVLYVEYNFDDLITTVCQYLYNINEIDDLEEFMYGEEVEDILCNLVEG